MLFLEPHARTVLILHAIVGAATVAAATHLCVWIRRYPRGQFAKHTAARWFATTALVLYGAQFALGNLLYPTYKVRVRAEYLDSMAAQLAEAKVRQAGATQANAPLPAPRDLHAVSRTFDVKEHWVALGLALAAAACAFAWAWDPRRDGTGGTTLFVGLALGAALCAWTGAILGLYTASFRAVGG